MTRTGKLAWAAGLLDGEGCIFIYADKRMLRDGIASVYHTLNVRIAMTHEKAIYRFRSIVKLGCCANKAPSYYDGRRFKRQWIWRAVVNDAVTVLKLLLPYLVTKKEEAIVAIRFFDQMDRHPGKSLPQSIIKKRHTCLLKLQALKKIQWA